MSYDYLRIAVGYNSGYTFMFDAGSLTLGGGLSVGLNRAFYDETLYDPFEYLMTKYHEKWQFSNKLSFTATWDGRDLKENTTKGYVISNQFSYAGGILGGLSNYLKNTTSFSWYRSLFTYKLGEKDANVVLGSTTTVSWMLPQFWNNTDDYYGVGTGWNWYDPKIGATRYEMLYIDGMNTGRGFSVLYDQSFLWDNQLSIGAPSGLRCSELGGLRQRHGGDVDVRRSAYPGILRVELVLLHGCWHQAEDSRLPAGLVSGEERQVAFRFRSHLGWWKHFRQQQ
ncbi:MAG: BamA/TamA family outer membrane protein [Sphaerochaeta sp.]|jgi:outer membrane protein insertion porin family|nr:BamA/TamA family outer membrane protein [Sphaerochaeta sp.]